MVIRTLTICALFCIAASSGQVEADISTLPQPYIEIRYYDGAVVTRENQIGSSTTTLAVGRPEIGFYCVKGGSTLLAGLLGVTEQASNPEYELMYAFQLIMADVAPVLYGRLYSLTFDRSGRIANGERLSFEKEIEYGKSYDLKFSAAGRPLTIQYVVFPDWQTAKVPQVTYGTNTLTLQTYCQAPENTQKVSSTHPLILSEPQPNLPEWGREPHVYTSEFSAGPSGRANEAMQYTVTVSFDPSLENAQYPLRTTLTFQREYGLDTDRTAGRPLTPDRTSGTVFTKEIELVKGRLLKLVFPPDSESLRGFLIQDTLIINP
ncbi:MAG: hypothetical protein NDJ18_04680 [candidate division Zixibacteria bacterium]|nr:hypothetical protein [candidate division Zixibacteria bacterium]